MTRQRTKIRYKEESHLSAILLSAKLLSLLTIRTRDVLAVPTMANDAPLPVKLTSELVSFPGAYCPHELQQYERLKTLVVNFYLNSY